MSDGERAPRATGGCLCGAVRYEVRGPLRDVVLCHCARCRRIHGHVAAYAACLRDHLALVDERGLRWYETEDRALGFCMRCGASLFWSAEGRDTMSVAAGSIDPPTGLETIAQIHVGHRGDYYEVCGPGVRHDAGLPAVDRRAAER
jgi:hypothetical protein